MTKTIFEKKWASPVAWGIEETPKIEGYIKFQVHFSLKKGLWFSVSIPNYGNSRRNPFECLLTALEYADVGMGKYCRLKERVRALDMWKKL